MLKGTRIIEGEKVNKFNNLINKFTSNAKLLGYEEVIVPSIWKQETFTGKVGYENSNMMWNFNDKSGRKVCLIPKVTGIFQEVWDKDWSKKYLKRKVFYVQRCYRYKRPQKGRYREFNQFGVEYLSNERVDKNLLINDLKVLLDSFPQIVYDEKVLRGLNYYTELGFEARVESLGAQNKWQVVVLTNKVADLQLVLMG